jgi:predicted HTH transcriptional regulator
VATNGGVLLIGMNREQVFPFAHVMCARFRGENRLDLFDRIEVHEHLPLVVDKVMEFLKKHAFLTAEFGEVRRRDVWSIPIDAIREVVINALVHASYSAKGSPIRVAFCDDRIEVDSPGGLLPGITVEDMVRGVSAIRNPTIARVFAEMDLVERWGTGIPGVFAAVAEDGLPAPEIAELPNAIRFTIFIKNHRPQIDPTPGTTRGAHPDADSGTSDHVEGQVEGQVEQRERAILAAANEPRSRAELLSSIGLGNKHERFARWVQPLLDAGLLAMTQPDSPRSPTQKYQITDAGRAVLRKQGGAT